MKLKISKDTLILVFIIVLSIEPLFFHLDSLTVRMWDEARTSVNALEMSLNGDYIVAYFDGAPDMYNTKPLLFTWIQVGFIKLFGYKILSFRLPSAIAGLFTICLSFYLSKKSINNSYCGFFSAITLITSYGYVVQHVTRTGDYDALLVFFLLFYSIYFFKFLEEDNENKTSCLAIFTLGLIAAVLTKGIAGFMLLPGLFIYTLGRNKFKSVVTNRNTYYSLLAIVFSISGFYLLREHFNPGYIDAVLENEVGRRYMTPLFNAEFQDDNLFYIRYLTNDHFFPWMYFIPLSVILLYFEENIKLKRFILFNLITSLSYLIIISLSKTKLGWYDAPFIAISSFIVGYFFNNIFWRLISYLNITSTKIQNLVLTIFTILIFSSNYRTIHMRILKNNDIWTPHEEQYAENMERLTKKSWKRFVVSYSNKYNGTFSPAIIFQQKLLNIKGNNITLKIPSSIVLGDTIMACNADSSNSYIKNNFICTILDSNDCVTYKILGLKNMK